MNDNKLSHNESNVEKAFSRQSSVFDTIYSPNKIIQYKRKRVRDHVIQWIAPGSEILELNAGTGEDAVWFAQNGFSVHATDISVGMQEKLVEKIKMKHLDSQVSYELCSFNSLDKLNRKGPYDLIFSNFAGLNCTGNLSRVLQSFDPLLKPGGVVTLVLLPKFCLWEFLLVFKGKFKTAFRRFNSKKGVKAHIEGTYFTCWYYNPSFVIDVMSKDYKLLGLEALCTLVPPSYFEKFPNKRKSLYNWLIKKENALKHKWPWKSIGDYYIISFKKK